MEKYYCKKCKKLTDEEEVICSNCGHKNRICKNCLRENTRKSIKCENCGKSIQDDCINFGTLIIIICTIIAVGIIFSILSYNTEKDLQYSHKNKNESSETTDNDNSSSNTSSSTNDYSKNDSTNSSSNNSNSTSNSNNKSNSTSSNNSYSHTDTDYKANKYRAPEKWEAKYMAELICKDELLSSSSAKWGKNVNITSLGNDKYSVSGTVTAKNLYGVELTKMYFAYFTFTGGGYKEGYCSILDN